MSRSRDSSYGFIGANPNGTNSSLFMDWNGSGLGKKVFVAKKRVAILHILFFNIITPAAVAFSNS